MVLFSCHTFVHLVGAVQGIANGLVPALAAVVPGRGVIVVDTFRLDETLRVMWTAILVFSIVKSPVITELPSCVNLRHVLDSSQNWKKKEKMNQLVLAPHKAEFIFRYTHRSYSG